MSDYNKEVIPQYGVQYEDLAGFKGLAKRSVFVIDQDGTVYIGSADGYLYAIYSDSAGLASSSWPKFRSDRRNTARVNASLTVPLGSVLSFVLVFCLFLSLYYRKENGGLPNPGANPK